MSRAAAGVEIEDLRILDQSGRDGVEQADLSKQPQSFGVVGDRPWLADQTGVALHQNDIDACGCQKIGKHQSDRTGADDRHVTAGPATRNWCRFPRSLDHSSRTRTHAVRIFLLHFIVILTI